ncbi:hypothetical protein AAVH_42943 [Aphelenchoides avenae]|nr:hypothetical protein AAVH_42943 [Aphelenchus avenae]
MWIGHRLEAAEKLGNPLIVNVLIDSMTLDQLKEVASPMHLRKLNKETVDKLFLKLASTVPYRS